jgi:hypothetical protein
MRWVPGVAVVLTLLLGAAPTSAQILFNEIIIRDSDNSHVDQVVELRNAGISSVAIGGWIFSHLGDYVSIPAGITLAPDGLLVAHFNKAGTNTSTNIYFPGQELAETSDLALYTANTVTNGGFSNPANIRAFVQWGGVPIGGRQAVAQNAGLWTSNTYVPLPAAGHSIELCSGTGITPGSYSDQPNPTVGDNNACHVATEEVSWGKVKSLFQ